MGHICELRERERRQIMGGEDFPGVSIFSHSESNSTEAGSNNNTIIENPYVIIVNNYKPENAWLNLNDMDIISEQMKKICKIQVKDKLGTGFFTYIPFPTKNAKLLVLITNNHILQQDDIWPKSKNSIKLFINNEKYCYYLDIDETTKTYTNPDYDITIVEIKDANNLLFTNNVLDIDEDIYNYQPNQIQIDNYKKLKVYLIQYPEAKEVKQSDGLIKNIALDNFSIEHTCKTTTGSSGSPILKIDNHKVIAVHRGNFENKNNLKSGILINAPINDFIKKYTLSNIQQKNLNINNNYNNFYNKNDEPKINGTRQINLNINNNYNNFYNKNDGTKINDTKQITIIYKKISDNQNMIKIFGDKFVENNIDKCRIDFEGQEYNLHSYIYLRQNMSEFKIILKGIEKINNLESMFEECNCLSSIPDISNLNTINVTKINRLFSGCNLLKTIPDISCWNTINIRDMSNIFSGCESLESLPNISKWDTHNAFSMNGIFFNCKSLKYLPDISMWNTDKVKDISSIFFGCESLTLLPNISKWNTINVTNMSNVFYGCKLLKKLPDIDLWNTKNVRDMSSLFFGCQSLTFLPNISNWNIQNVFNIRGIFQSCKNLTTLPDISNWNTIRVKDMSEMCSGCSKLLEMPDISKWKTNYVTNMKGMFFKCETLYELPDLTKWNINNVMNMSYMFYECFSLSYSPNIESWNLTHVKNKEKMFYGSKLNSSVTNNNYFMNNVLFY